MASRARLSRCCTLLGLQLGCMGWVWGCRDPETGTHASTPTRADASTPAGAPVDGSRPQSRAGSERLDSRTRIRFADGVVVEDVEAQPSLGTKERTIDVRWKESGALPGSFRSTVLTPNMAAWQTVPPTPLELPPSAWSNASATGVALALPQPWFVRSAVVVLERLDVHGRRVAAIDGPRRSDGLGVLAVVPTPTQPAFVGAARRTITIDGRLEPDEWSGDGAALFDSLDGEPNDAFATEVRFAWDDELLVLGARVLDADVWGTYGERDDPLYREEVIEWFLAADDSGTHYVELEVSPRAVVFDAAFARYREGDVKWNGDVRAAVALQGTLERHDRDHGWTVELAIQWASLCAATSIECPPRAGQRIRMNVYRIEHPKRRAAVGLALSPTGQPDFHAWKGAAVMELQP